MKLTQVLNSLEQQGLKYELNGALSYPIFSRESINEYNANESNYLELGVNIAPNKWAWFKSYDILEDKPYFHFTQIYNQNTGKTIKAFKTGFNLINKLGLN